MFVSRVTSRSWLGYRPEATGNNSRRFCDPKEWVLRSDWIGDRRIKRVQTRSGCNSAAAVNGSGVLTVTIGTVSFNACVLIAAVFMWTQLDGDFAL